MYTKCVPDACGGQKRVLDSLELELEMIVSHQWELGTPGSSARAARALKSHLSSLEFGWFSAKLNMHVP